MLLKQKSDVSFPATFGRDESYVVVGDLTKYGNWSGPQP